MKHWITTLAVGSLLSLGSFTQASNLEKIANFHQLYTQQEVLDSLKDSRSISDFIAEVFDLPSEEKYLASMTYLQNHNLNTTQFINLIQALMIARIHDDHADAIIGLYVSSREARFSEENFHTLMNLFSNDAFSAMNEGANWPFQFLSKYLEYRFLNVEEMKSFASHFKKLGIPPLLIDQTLFPQYIQTRGTRLEPGDVQDLLTSLERDQSSVKSAAEIISSYVRVNASRLTQPEFRSGVEELRKKAPYTIGAQTGSDLSESALEVLYWSEFEYFKPWWKRENIITTVSYLMEEWNTLASEESTKIAKAFLQRNEHRLSSGAIQKIQNQFEI